MSLEVLASMAEKLCLRWNDFKNNTFGAFASLREDKDFADVTLVSSDGQQVEAHKVVLAASSSFLQDLLLLNRHPHPIIFMRGVMSEDLLAIVDFLYFGEANVKKESLDSFLALAAELKVKGLLEGKDTVANSLRKSEVEIPLGQAEAKPRLNTSNNKRPLKKSPLTVEAGEFGEVIPVIFEGSEEMRALDEKIQSLMDISGNKIFGKTLSTQKCKVCGKEGHKGTIKKHIEANHLEGFSIPCHVCGQVYGTSFSLKHHTTVVHSQQVDSREWTELDGKIQELMEKSGNTKSCRERLAHKCKVCGKEGQSSAIKEHIEANHLDGISISCNYCDKILGTRHALKQHITLCH